MYQVPTYICITVFIYLLQLGHLKRIQKSVHVSTGLILSKDDVFDISLLNGDTLCMIICPVECENNDIDVVLKSMFLATFVVNVCNTAPSSKLEFENWNKYWPIIFHPNERERQLSMSIINNQIEIQQLKFCKIMNEAVAEDANKLGVFGWKGGAVIINPFNQKVNNLVNIVICLI